MYPIYWRLGSECEFLSREESEEGPNYPLLEGPVAGPEGLWVAHLSAVYRKISQLEIIFHSQKEHFSIIIDAFESRRNCQILIKDVWPL